MSIKLNGIKNETVTFRAEGTIPAGTPVMPSANYMVTPATSGKPFVGVAVNQSNNLVGVQLTGYMEFHYSSSAPFVGFTRLAADGNGGVMVESGGRDCAVVYVDTINKIVGILI